MTVDEGIERMTIRRQDWSNRQTLNRLIGCFVPDY
jgi:hypothetical protein